MWKVCPPRKWPGVWIVRKPRSDLILRTRGSSSGVTWNKGSGNDMKHPSEAMLALFAGRDLGFFARWRTGRHLAGCERCRGEIETFGGMRDHITALDELQGISWNRLAAEMKANIRVGLEAGECVALEPSRAPLFGGARALAAYASVALLLLAGLWLQRVTPPAHTAQRGDGRYGHATANGADAPEGDQAFG